MGLNKTIAVSTTSISLTSIDDDEMQLGERYYIMGAFGMATIGILTNILNIIVLSMKSMKSTTNRYLWALAICDLCVLVLSLITLSNSFAVNDFNEQLDKLDFGDELRTNSSSDSTLLSSENSETQSLIARIYSKWSMEVYPYIYPYIYPLAIMFQASTVWMSLVMSLDRFIAIHFPLRSLKFCTLSIAKKLIVLVFLAAFIYCSPRFFEYYTRVDSLESLTIINIDLTKVGKSSLFRQLIYVWFYIIFQSVFPLVALAIINLHLLVSLWKSERTTPATTMNSESSRSINRTSFARRDVTIMIITVVLLFVVLQTPSVVCNCIYGTNYRGLAFSNKSSGINLICNIGNIFILTCSSQTFFLYFIFNKKFRHKFLTCVGKIVLCNRRRLHKNPTLRTTSYSPVALHQLNRESKSKKTDSSVNYEKQSSL